LLFLSPLLFLNLQEEKEETNVLRSFSQVHGNAGQNISTVFINLD